MVTMLSGVELPFPQGDKKLLCIYHTLRLMCISPDMHIYTPLPWQRAGYQWGIFAIHVRLFDEFTGTVQ